MGKLPEEVVTCLAVWLRWMSNSRGTASDWVLAKSREVGSFRQSRHNTFGCNLQYYIRSREISFAIIFEKHKRKKKKNRSVFQLAGSDSFAIVVCWASETLCDERDTFDLCCAQKSPVGQGRDVIEKRIDCTVAIEIRERIKTPPSSFSGLKRRRLNDAQNSGGRRWVTFPVVFKHQLILSLLFFLSFSPSSFRVFYSRRAVSCCLPF